MSKVCVKEVASTACHMVVGYAAISVCDQGRLVDITANIGWTQLVVMYEIAGQALRLEALYNAMPGRVKDDANGVWFYEVPEPFGAWLSAFLLENGEAPCQPVMDRKIKQLVAEFFYPKESEPTAHEHLLELLDQIDIDKEAQDAQV